MSKKDLLELEIRCSIQLSYGGIRRTGQMIGSCVMAFKSKQEEDESRLRKNTLARVALLFAQHGVVHDLRHLHLDDNFANLNRHFADQTWHMNILGEENGEHPRAHRYKIPAPGKEATILF
jgi:hypothetical protein